MTDKQGFYLRMPVEVRAELEQAHWDTHQNRDEILLQAFAIWLHAQRRGSLALLLEKVGYQGKQHPERAQAVAVQPRAEANGRGPSVSVDTDPDDPWDLDRPGVS